MNVRQKLYDNVRIDPKSNDKKRTASEYNQIIPEKISLCSVKNVFVRHQNIKY